MKKIELKTKITEKGNLLIRIKDTIYEKNDQIISFYTEDNIFGKEEIKAGKYYKVSNIGTTLEKKNLVPIKYKEQIDKDVEEVKKLLEEHRLSIVYEENVIKFKNSPCIISQRNRNSCGNFIL
jgi:hypothetical protein